MGDLIKKWRRRNQNLRRYHHYLMQNAPFLKLNKEGLGGKVLLDKTPGSELFIDSH